MEFEDVESLHKALEFNGAVSSIYYSLYYYMCAYIIGFIISLL